MRPTVSEVVGTLRFEGLLAAERVVEVAPRLRTLDVVPPWYVRALSGLGGWTAALFLFAFAYFLHLDDAVALGAGLGALAVAITLRRLRHNPFSNQLALALALLGELLALHAIHGMQVGSAEIALATVGIELLLVVLYPDPLMRFVSTICAGVAASSWIYVVTDGRDLTLEVWFALAAGLALFVLRPKTGRGWVSPVAYGLTVTSLGAMAFTLTGPSFWQPFHLGPLTVWGIAAISAVASAVLLYESKARTDHWLVAAAMLVGLVVLWKTPGVLAATTLLGMGYARRDSKLLAVGTAFLLLFGAQFYYLLDWSLLVKSGTLIASGVLFLALHLYVARSADEA